jgi:hypothetical protein
MGLTMTAGDPLLDAPNTSPDTPSITITAEPYLDGCQMKWQVKFRVVTRAGTDYGCPKAEDLNAALRLAAEHIVLALKNAPG